MKQNKELRDHPWATYEGIKRILRSKGRFRTKYKKRTRIMTDDNMLFHYTSQTGLYGILNDGKIWATNIRYLNDYKEIIHSWELTKQIISETFKDKVSVKDELLQHAEYFVKMELPISMICVTSFSEKGDLLSQWRGYCKNETGYSIGISHSALSEIAKKNNVELVKCIYDHSEQISELTTHVKWVYDNLAVVESSVSTLDLQKAIQYLVPNVLTVARRFKDASFSEEREWRLVSGPFQIQINDPRIELRQGKSSLIPYIKLSLMPLESLKIYVGPTPDKELAKDAVHYLLNKKQITGSKVELSKVPFKSW